MAQGAGSGEGVHCLMRSGEGPARRATEGVAGVLNAAFSR
jgi:hypothetical protein